MAGADSPRSVLEGKERSELAVMAAALDLSVAPRAKKSDVIDAILQKTGAGDEVTPAKRGPGRPRKAAVDMSETGTEQIAGEAADEPSKRGPGRPRKMVESADQSTSTEPEMTFHAAPVVETTPSPESGNGDGARTAYPPRTQTPRRDNEGAAPRPQGQGQGQAYQDRNTQSRDPNELGNRRGRRRGRGRDREREPGQGPNGVEQSTNYQGELVSVKGLLDLREEGYGFLRTGGYLPSPKDVYVSVGLVRRFALRKGDAIEGACRAASSSEKYPALIRIDAVSGHDPEEAKNRSRFEDLTPLFPDSQLRLETGDDPNNLTARIVDLISPIGKGQRGLIVSPPKAGKTTIMKQIAHSIEANNP